MRRRLGWWLRLHRTEAAIALAGVLALGLFGTVIGISLSSGNQSLASQTRPGSDAQRGVPTTPPSTGGGGGLDTPTTPTTTSQANVLRADRAKSDPCRLMDFPKAGAALHLVLGADITERPSASTGGDVFCETSVAGDVTGLVKFTVDREPVVTAEDFRSRTSYWMTQGSGPIPAGPWNDGVDHVDMGGGSGLIWTGQAVVYMDLVGPQLADHHVIYSLLRTIAQNLSAN